MVHEMLYPPNYINQWHHVFTVSCLCGWESKVLGDSTRREAYRDPVKVSEAEYALHVRCARIEECLHKTFQNSKHPIDPEQHDWSLHFDNSIESYYLIRCSCGWQTANFKEAVKVRETAQHYTKDMTTLRKLIRRHTFQSGD